MKSITSKLEGTDYRASYNGWPVAHNIRCQMNSSHWVRRQWLCWELQRKHINQFSKQWRVFYLLKPNPITSYVGPQRNCFRCHIVHLNQCFTTSCRHLAIITSETSHYSVYNCTEVARVMLVLLFRQMTKRRATWLNAHWRENWILIIEPNC